jgi:hypothetical protein
MKQRASHSRVCIIDKAPAPEALHTEGDMDITIGAV